MAAPQLNDNETYGWAYAPPGRLPGEPAVPIPDLPPGLEIPANRATRLPSGVVAYRETVGHHNRMQELDRQSAAARQAAQQAVIDARMLDQMSRVAKSTKDIEIARRSIAVSAFQRDFNDLTSKGVPVAQALYQATARNPLAFGSGFGTALRTTTPATQFNPREVQVGPNKLVETAPNRFSFPPSTASLENQKRVGTEMTTPSGLHAVWVGPNQIRLTEKAESKELTPAQLLDYADSLRFSRSPTDKAKAQAIMDFIGEKVQKQITPPTVAKSGASVSVLGQGTKEDPARPETKEQFDSMPSGAIYRNPSDGKLYRKK